MDFIDHKSTANFKFGLSSTDEKVRITRDGDVGIGVSSPSTKLEVDGTVTADDVSLATKAVIGGATPRIELFESDTTDVNTRIRNTAGTLQIQSTDDAGTTSKTRIALDHATGDISFREDTGSNAKLYWDASAESLGIGTSSPAENLHVAGNIRFGDTSPAHIYTNGNELRLGVDNNNDNAASDITFYVDTSEKMRIDASGNVGIGSSAPAVKLDIVDTSDDVQMRVYKNDGTNNTRLTLTADDDGAKIHYRDATNGGALRFNNNAGEMARFDVDGNLGIGTTSASSALSVEDGNAAVASFNRTATGGTAVGSVVEFERAGTLAGHIGSQSNGYFYIGQSDCNLAFSSTNNLIFPRGTDGVPRDGEINLGNSSNRFNNLNLSGDAVLSSTSSNLLVGKTSTGASNIGTQLSGDGYAAIVNTSNNIPLYLENKATNGNCRISFTNDSHGVASFGLNNGGDFTIFDTTASTTRFIATTGKVLTASGGLAGIQLGGTAAADTLDDYEEGSWTPVLSDGTNTVTLDTKAYTKVGRMVTCTISTYNKDTSSLSGNIKITGLPFQGLNTDQSVPLYWRDGGDAGDSVFGYLSANSTELNVRENRGAAASATNIAATSATTIFVTFTYQTS